MDIDISKYKPNGTPWSFHDDEQLDKMYNDMLFDINKISVILNRTPGSIISQLCKNKYINTRTSARGYMTYKNSDLYKSIVSSGEAQKRVKQQAKEKPSDNISININGISGGDYVEIRNDIKEMKLEITSLKHTIKELVDMLNAVYEFENINKPI
jgi:hypothetical protein